MGWQSDAGNGTGDEPAQDPGPGLAGFGPGGAWESRAPSAALAVAVEAAAGEGYRCEGGSQGETLGVARAAATIESWACAIKLGALRAAIREDDDGLPGVKRHGDLPDEWSRSLTHDVALALSMSPVSAGNLLQTAWDLGTLLPRIGALLEDGTLTYPKARVINDALELLGERDKALAEALIAPAVGGKTFGQVERIAAQAAATVDPDLAERTREHAERNRARVTLRRERSGAAMLSGSDLPPAETLAAHAAVCARAQQYQDSGAFPEVLTDQLRAMAYLDLMNEISAEARIGAGQPDSGLGAPAEAAFRRDPEPDDPGQAARPGSGGSDCPCQECDGRCTPPTDAPSPDGGPDDPGADDLGPDDYPDDRPDDHPHDGPDSGPDDPGQDDLGPDGEDVGHGSPDNEPGPSPDDRKSESPSAAGPGSAEPDNSGPGCSMPNGGARPGAGRHGDDRPPDQRCRDCNGHCLPRADDVDAGPPGCQPPAAPPPPASTPPSQWPGSGASSPWSASPASPAPPKRADLIVPLATLLGRPRRPGESHGFGTLDPALCRALAALAAASPHTTACVTVTDRNGYAIGHGCLRTGRRKAKLPGAPDPPLTALPARLNLTITAAQLANLLVPDAGPPDRPSGRPAPPRPAPTTGWGLIPPRVPDRRALPDEQDRRVRPDEPDEPDDPDQPRPQADPGWCGTWTITVPSGLQYDVDLEPVPTHGCDHRRESLAYEPNDTLRHLVQIRDYECTFPTCSRHARESDFEHAVPYDQGGRTCGCNAGARSRACHQVKQSPGWTVTQPKPGWHQWQTPSGRTYTQEPKRYPS
ncbi:MAG TPA: DUF222 domain-containing protein [Trebonia sp.]|nr:DUF222 domain-containing protein [Trebonia sp.]